MVVTQLSHDCVSTSQISSKFPTYATFECRACFYTQTTTQTNSKYYYNYGTYQRRADARNRRTPQGGEQHPAQPPVRTCPPHHHRRPRCSSCIICRHGAHPLAQIVTAQSRPTPAHSQGGRPSKPFRLDCVCRFSLSFIPLDGADEEGVAACAVFIRAGVIKHAFEAHGEVVHVE